MKLHASARELGPLASGVAGSRNLNLPVQAQGSDERFANEDQNMLCG
jgi:hypothetical protein